MKIFFVTALLTICTFSLKAQTTLKGVISGFDDIKHIKIEYASDGRFLKDQRIALTEIDKTDSFSINLKMNQAGLVVLFFEKNNGQRNYLQLYIKPNTTLEFYTNFDDFVKDIVFKGEMAEENLFFMQNELKYPTNDSAIYKAHFDKDTIPSQCFANLQTKEKESLQRLQTYHKKNTLDKDFLAFAQRNITHYYKYVFLSFAGTHYWYQYISTPRITIFENQKWGQASKKELQFLLKEPQEIDLKSYWFGIINSPNRSLMLPYLFNDTIPKVEISISGFKRNSMEGEDLLNKLYKSKNLELFYANYIDELCHNRQEFIGDMYERFKKKHPNSLYISLLEPKIREIMALNEVKNKELPKDIQVIEKPYQFKNLADLLKPFAGKVVLIDLWGTWCSPCIEELKYLPELKKHFADKEVAFLYIASEGAGEERKNIWLNTIKYNHLTGTHLIGNSELFENIREKLTAITEEEIKAMPQDMQETAKNYKEGKEKYMSFPTYIIADKQGNIVVKYAYKPSSKKHLYKQIEEVLKIP